MAISLNNLLSGIKKKNNISVKSTPNAGSVSVASPKPLPPLSVSSSPTNYSSYSPTTYNPQQTTTPSLSTYNPQKTVSAPTFQPASTAPTLQPSASIMGSSQPDTSRPTITLPSGQKISGQDPNYASYATQYPVSTTGQPMVSSANVTPSVAIDTYKDNVVANAIKSQTPQPIAPDRSSLDQAYKDYIASLSPSDKSQQAYQNYLDFVANTSKAITGLEGQGRGIEAGLIRGQQEKELRLRQPDEARLLGEYQGLVNEDQSRQQGLFAGLGFAQSQYDDQQTAYEKQLARFEPVQIGDNLVQLNPDTGEYDVVYSTAGGGQELKTLSPGQTLYDPNTGQALFTAPESQDPLDMQKKQLEIQKLQKEIEGGGSTGIELQIKELQLQKLQQELTSGQEKQGKASSSALYKANEAINLIDEILPDISNLTSGFLGGTMAKAKGTPAYNLAADINTLQAQIGFEALQAMRDASPTGGALGQVSERELQLLTSTLRSLDPGQTPDQLKENLNKVKDHYKRAKALIYADRQGYTEKDFNDAIKANGIDDVLQFFESQFFNNVGGDTNEASNIQLGSRLAKVNNNPGNLRFVGQTGATQGEGGFAKFSTPQAGYQALKNQISLDSSRGLSLSQFINKYAPPVENNTSQYLQQIIKATGANSNTPIKNINLDTLAKAIALKESSTKIV